MADFRADLLSAYFVTASRIGAWAVVSALVVRMGGAGGFGEVSLGRSVVTMLMYVSLGVSPVLLRRLVEAYGRGIERDVPGEGGGEVLGYAVAQRGFGEFAGVFRAGWALMLLVGVLVALGALVGGVAVAKVGVAVMCMMVGGMLARVMGDVPGMVLQARGRLAVDNILVAMGEWSWPGMMMAWQIFMRPPGTTVAETAAGAFLVTGLGLTLVRMVAALVVLGGEKIRLAAVEGERALGRMGWAMLAPAALLMVGHLADFCYAPMNQVLLGRWGGSGVVAIYAPALQIDAALLLLTGAIAAVMLPRMTRALAERDFARARREYVRATLASMALLVVAGAFIAVIARELITAWLGGGVPEEAVWVARLVLIHTVLGGAAGTSRAVMLAAGRYRAYTTAALVGGVANVLGVFCVLGMVGWGAQDALKWAMGGVVGVTILTVGVRCGVWMPWYVMRLLRRMEQEGDSIPLAELAGGGEVAMIPPTPPKPGGV